MSSAAPSPAAPEAVAVSGEKKQITVLFADVAGSMDLQEKLDAEVWAEIMGRFVSILAEGVRKYGGTVDKFTGDGIMALFGAPVAQEDHARRACHAAWELTKAIDGYAEKLQRDQGVELHVRLGLNSGEVVVGRVGDDVTLDPTALGHTVGLAQRMEAMAEPGRAYLTENTANLVHGWFELQGLGPRSVKGATAPLQVSALGAPAPSPARRTVGASRLFGRERELAVLDDAFEMACRGQFQVVGVVGEAGVGKSRLCDDFARQVIERGITVRRATGISHGKGVPLVPILAFQREYFGITDADDAATARRKVTDRLLDLDPGLEDALAMMFDFLEVPDPNRPVPPMAPEARMRRIFDVVRRVTARRSEREALVLIFEDLHWFDPSSEAFLERLVESYPGSRTLVVTNFRPEFSARWMRHSYYRQIPLGPLGNEEVEELLADWLGQDRSLTPLIELVLERTGGNPFFIEEVARTLIEAGTLAGERGQYRLVRPLEDVRVPPTVQAVLAARIDRLPSGQKTVLQTASVIGRVFDLSLLSEVAGVTQDQMVEVLWPLCVAELVHEAGQEPVPTYRFWHPLTQEVAHRTLLAAQRRLVHGRVAAALARRSGGENERAAIVAHHYNEAGAAPEAARWEHKAATWALRRDVGDAVARWRRVLSHLAEVGDGEDSLALSVRARTQLLRVGGRLGIPADEASALYEDGRRDAERLGDVSLAVMITHAYAVAVFLLGHPAKARATALEAIRLAETVDDQCLRASVHTGLVAFSATTGPLADGLRFGEEALRMAETIRGRTTQPLGYDPYVYAIHFTAEVLALAGQLDRARSEAERAVSLARDLTETEMLGWALSLLARLADVRGTADDATNRAAEAVRVAQETGNVALEVVALHSLGVAEFVAGDSEASAEAMRKAFHIARDRNTIILEPAILAGLARAESGLGHDDQARAYADQAVAVAQRQKASVVECYTRLVRARLLREAGDNKLALLAREELLIADALAIETGAVSYEAMIAEETARLDGEPEALAQAARRYESIGATGHARRLEAELAAGSRDACT